MMDNRAQALKLKEEGNRHFSRKDYTSAESCYSQAYASLIPRAPRTPS